MTTETAAALTARMNSISKKAKPHSEMATMKAEKITVRPARSKVSPNARVDAPDSALVTKGELNRLGQGISWNTADAVVPGRFLHFDLKTGLRRNYREQMAAYSLGFMEAHFAESWSAHLLYCDLREIESLAFSRDEARELVAAVIAAFVKPGKTPVPCDYCGWCAKADTCEARRALAAEGLKAAGPDFDFEAVVAEPAALGRFLAACAVVEEFRERARAIATERLRGGGELPGWKLITRKGSDYVDAVTVGHHIQALGFGPVLSAYGNLSARKFRQLWEERRGGRPFPEEAVKHSPPVSYLKQIHPKPSKPEPNQS